MNVLANLPAKVGDGSKNATCEEIALDLVEPQLHLVKPRRVGGREVEAHFGVVGQELLNGFGLVCREIIEHDVDLLRPAGALDEVRYESDELVAGVAFGCFALHLSRFHIERGIQRQRSMPVVFKSMPFGSPGR